MARFIVMLGTWIYARTSYVFEISVELRGDILGSRSFLSNFFLMLLQLVVIYVVEILLTTKFEEPSIHEQTLNRLIYANIALLLAEVSLALTLFLELGNLQSMNFVLSIITGISFLTLLLNSSTYLTYWLIVGFYIIGMVLYISPHLGELEQQPTERKAIVLFLRSVILPI